MRLVRALVLPDPAPAKISTGPRSCRTACCCGSLRLARSGELGLNFCGAGVSGVMGRLYPAGGECRGCENPGRKCPADEEGLIPLVLHLRPKDASLPGFSQPRHCAGTWPRRAELGPMLTLSNRRYYFYAVPAVLCLALTAALPARADTPDHEAAKFASGSGNILYLAGRGRSAAAVRRAVWDPPCPARRGCPRNQRDSGGSVEKLDARKAARLK